MYMKQQIKLTNSITEEGINRMKFLAGQGTSFWNINIKALIDLFYLQSDKLNDITFGIINVYELGRIDGIRQERSKIKSKISNN